MKVERTHDLFYLKENYKNNPKEYFKVLGNLIGTEINLRGGGQTCNLLDVGCETGSFLHYIKSIIPQMSFSGMDILPELLNEVNQDNEININTICADITNEESIPSDCWERFDFITMLGVLSIFDNFEPAINNALRMLKDDGVLWIFGIFNPENLDVLIKSKYSDRKTDHWESGWNLFSLHSIELYCNKNNLRYEILPFEINIDIEKREDDPLRSWTIMMKDEKRLIVNGLQLVHNFYFIKISKCQTTRLG